MWTSCSPRPVSASQGLGIREVCPSRPPLADFWFFGFHTNHFWHPERTRHFRWKVVRITKCYDCQKIFYTSSFHLVAAAAFAFFAASRYRCITSHERRIKTLTASAAAAFDWNSSQRRLYRVKIIISVSLNDFCCTHIHSLVLQLIVWMDWVHI